MKKLIILLFVTLGVACSELDVRDTNQLQSHQLNSGSIDNGSIKTLSGPYNSTPGTFQRSVVTAHYTNGVYDGADWSQTIFGIPGDIVDTEHLINFGSNPTSIMNVTATDYGVTPLTPVTWYLPSSAAYYRAKHMTVIGSTGLVVVNWSVRLIGNGFNYEYWFTPILSVAGSALIYQSPTNIPYNYGYDAVSMVNLFANMYTTYDRATNIFSVSFTNTKTPSIHYCPQSFYLSGLKSREYSYSNCSGEVTYSMAGGLITNGYGANPQVLTAPGSGSIFSPGYYWKIDNSYITLDDAIGALDGRTMNMANGAMVILNPASTTCNYIPLPCPPAGQFLYEVCISNKTYRVLTNGSCGTINQFYHNGCY